MTILKRNLLLKSHIHLENFPVGEAEKKNGK